MVTRETHGCGLGPGGSLAGTARLPTRQVLGPRGPAGCLHDLVPEKEHRDPEAQKRNCHQRKEPHWPSKQPSHFTGKAAGEARGAGGRKGGLS